jgi:drug/metabolite transporter (DMT)-like permease
MKAGDMRERPANRKGLVAPALLVAVVAVSFASVFFRKAAPTHPLVQAGVRLAIASLLLSPGLVRAIRGGRVNPSVIRHAVLGGVLYGIHFGTWVTSLTLTTVAASVTLVSATPLLLGLVALITGRDKPDRHHYLSIALAVLGLIIIGWHDFGVSREAITGDILALGGAAAMAVYLLVVRRLGISLDVWAFACITTGTGAVILLSSCLIAGIPIRLASMESLCFLALAALVPQMIGHNLLTWACRHVRPVVVGMATVAEPVGAAILAWFFLGEAVVPLVGLGCAVTLAAVALSLWEHPTPVTQTTLNVDPS